MRQNAVQNNTNTITSSTNNLISPTALSNSTTHLPGNLTSLSTPAPAITQTSIASAIGSSTAAFSFLPNNKVSVALLTDRGTKPASPISKPTPGTQNGPTSPAQQIGNPNAGSGITEVQTSAQGNTGSPVQTQGVGDVIASALGLTTAAGTNNRGNNGSPTNPSPDSNNGAPQVANNGGSQVTNAPAAPSSGGETENINNSGQGIVVGGQTIQPGQAATIGGQVISVPSGSNGAQGIVVGSQIIQPGQVATISGQIISATNGNGVAQGIIVGGQTIQPGQAATINGQAVSVPPTGGNLVVGGTTIGVSNVPNAAIPTPPTLTFGGTTITANPSNGFVVTPGLTASAGGPAVTIGGSTISIAAGGSIGVINGQTQTLATDPTSAPVLTLGGMAITASVSGSSTAFVLAPGQTLTPGGALTVSGTIFSLPAGGSAVVVDGKTSTLGSSPLNVPVLSFGAQTITAKVSGSSTAFVFAPGQTLTPGGSLVLSGTIFSLPATGSAIIINGQSSILSSPNPTPAPLLTINGLAITASVANDITSFVLGPGMTLTPGGPSVVISGTTFSLPKSGTGIVVNGQFSTLGQSDSSITAAPALTIDGHTYSATLSNGKPVYDLGFGTTLTPGGIITLGDGTKVTLASDGSFLIIGTSTSKISNTPKSASAKTTSATTMTSSSKTSSASADATHTSKKGEASYSCMAFGTTTMAIYFGAIYIASVLLGWGLWV
jgi:hypothetical protein